MRILIVEDAPKTGDPLRQGLSWAGMLADLARVPNLRVKIDDAFDAKLIHTVRGMGHVLAAR